MMILSGTKTLTASLAAAPATTQPTFVVAYAEVNAAAITEDTNEVTATGTTPVTVLSSPAAGFRRVIKSLFVTNLDTVPTTVTVFINGFPAGKATIGSGLSVDLASSTAIPVTPGQVATATLMGNNSGVNNVPFALSATASLTLLGIPGLQTSGITGNLTLSKTGVTARTQTARDASGNLCLDSVDNAFSVTQRFNAAEAIACGVIPTAGNGLLQLASGTTQATGVAHGDTYQFRNATGQISQTGPAATDIVYNVVRSTGESIAITAGNGSGIIGTISNNRVLIRTNGADAINIDTSQNTGFQVAPTAGNGLVQLASGTTKANGVAFGADVSLFRSGAGTLDVLPSSGAGQLRVFDSSSVTAVTVYADSATAILSVITNKPLEFRTNNTVALTINTSQGVTTAAANYVKVRSVAASAGTTTLDATDDTAILTGATTHTFTLPAAAAGRRLFLKNRSSGALTVNRAGADTIDGGTTLAVATGTAKILIANGTDWCVWNA